MSRAHFQEFEKKIRIRPLRKRDYTAKGATQNWNDRRRDLYEVRFGADNGNVVV